MASVLQDDRPLTKGQWLSLQLQSQQTAEDDRRRQHAIDGFEASRQAQRQQANSFAWQDRAELWWAMPS